MRVGLRRGIFGLLRHNAGNPSYTPMVGGDAEALRVRVAALRGCPRLTVFAGAPPWYEHGFAVLVEEGADRLGLRYDGAEAAAIDHLTRVGGARGWSSSTRRGTLDSSDGGVRGSSCGARPRSA